MLTIAVIDDVIRALDEQLLAHAPERGGALLGPPGQTLVTQFIFDAEAETTTATYAPSPGLTEQIRDQEVATQCELKGIVHTHPGTLDRPSGPDESAVAGGLALNPHLGSYMCPILNSHGSSLGAARPSVADHQTALQRGKASWFVGVRRRGGGLIINEARCRIVPITADSWRVADYLGIDPPTDVGIVEIEGRLLFGRQFFLGRDAELTLLFSPEYPLQPPIAMLGGHSESTEQLQLTWPLAEDEETRLLKAIEAHVHRCGQSNRRPYRLAWGPSATTPLTTDAARGRAAAWRQIVTDADVDERSTAIRDAALARTRGLLPPNVADKTVIIFGLGTVGSYMAEQFVRSGTDRIILVDPDQVETANLSRACYRLADVGKPKVEALAAGLLDINPRLIVECHSKTVQELGIDLLGVLGDAADLVVAATDDSRAQLILNRVAYAHDKPAMFIGLYTQARGGEVILSVPSRTPCYHCATRFRHAIARADDSVTVDTDYGTGRLVGEVALGVDIHHVATAAVKLGLSLLVPSDSPGALHHLAEQALANNTPYGIFSMDPEFPLVKAFLEDTPGQLAFNSIWCSVERDPQCSTCGEPGWRHPIDRLVVQTPSTEALRGAIASTTNRSRAQLGHQADPPAGEQPGNREGENGPQRSGL